MSIAESRRAGFRLDIDVLRRIEQRAKGLEECEEKNDIENFLTEYYLTKFRNRDWDGPTLILPSLGTAYARIGDTYFVAPLLASPSMEVSDVDWGELDYSMLEDYFVAAIKEILEGFRKLDRI